MFFFLPKLLPPVRAGLMLLAGAAVLPSIPAEAAPPATVRFATYNVSFFRGSAGALMAELGNPAGTTVNHGNIRQVAEALQRIRPDVLLLNEFDHDTAGEGMRLFHDHFLAVPQKAGLEALSYPWRYSAASNTGVPSGFDLDNNGGTVTTPGTEPYGNDCFGFGIFPGQYGLAVFSRFPVREDLVRSFQLFKWRDMPDSQLLRNTGSPPLATYYTEAERGVLRLSSKTHLDVPVDLGGGILAHFLVSHPTPPSFDGAEDKNGKRNYDEIRLWADYIDPARSGYLTDDAGRAGGLAAGARFVIAGDQNADPLDGDTVAGAARQLTTHALVNAVFVPSSSRYGGGGAGFPGGGGQSGNKNHDTAAFSGGLRVDYVLPSKAGFSIFDGAVLWPGSSHELRAVIGDTDPSDHHMVWMDLRPQISVAEAVRNFRAEWNGTAVTLHWLAAAGYTYRVQESATMAPGSWSDTGLVPVVTPDTFEVAVEVPAGGSGRRFCRLEVSFTP